MIGTSELILVLVGALLLFGPSKLPELAHSLGKAAGEFKKAQIETEHELKRLNKPLRDIDIKTSSLAKEMGINVENKTSEQIFEEIRSKIKPDEKPKPPSI